MCVCVKLCNQWKFTIRSNDRMEVRWGDWARTFLVYHCLLSSIYLRNKLIEAKWQNIQRTFNILHQHASQFMMVYSDLNDELNAVSMVESSWENYRILMRYTKVFIILLNISLFLLRPSPFSLNYSLQTKPTQWRFIYIYIQCCFAY